jgi:hypothetical protein
MRPILISVRPAFNSSVMMASLMRRVGRFLTFVALPTLATVIGDLVGEEL